MALLEVDNLRVKFAGSAAVDGVSFTLNAGESLGIVGESGSGKTQTALAIMGLTPADAQVSGRISFEQQSLLEMPATMLQRIRAQRIAMVFQDPRSALNPYVRIGDQLDAILLEHRLAEKTGAKNKTLEMLAKVGLPDPERQYRAWPHQLSGGMRQRALIASALLAEPDILIADEPTTALDVTVQAQILALLAQLREELNLAMLLITHDLAVIAGNCQKMLVLDAGQTVEAGEVATIFARPSHERTAELLKASRYEPASVEPAVENDSGEQRALLQVSDIAVSYAEQRARPGHQLNAVLPLTFELFRGETLAIVGESGSGKTSLIRAMLGLVSSSNGTVSFAGSLLDGSVGSRPVNIRRKLQMVFQEPLASLDPAMRVDKIIAEPLLVHCRDLNETQRDEQVAAMLQRVGLDTGLSKRFPHQLSGGQAQRVAIARALIMKPAVLVCDEAVAALDSSVRREILDLLLREQQRTALSLIMITHDLRVVRHMAHRVLVMYLGRVCEMTAAEQLFRRPRHPYSRALIDAMPLADPGIAAHAPAISGEVGSVLHPPSGCVFHPRCEYAQEDCRSRVPESQAVAGGTVTCLRSEQLDLRESRIRTPVTG